MYSVFNCARMYTHDQKANHNWEVDDHEEYPNH